MPEIKHALTKLDSVVGKLEDSMEGFEEVLAGQQRDMFSAPSNQNASATGGNMIDGAVVADKIDQAIEKVEAVLKEG